MLRAGGSSRCVHVENGCVQGMCSCLERVGLGDVSMLRTGVSRGCVHIENGCIQGMCPC